MEFLADYGLFFAKTLTIVVAVAAIIVLIVSAGGRGKRADKGHIEVTHLNEKFEDMRETLREAVLDPEALKQHEKAEKKRLKDERTQQKKLARQKAPEAAAGDDSRPADDRKKRVFVLDFVGDIKASACDSLREEINAVLTLATPADEVVVKIESGGGMVHSYGLASSQLARFGEHKIPLTVCVDKVAASGGYMMACVADRILAAPFAVLGSIGVVAQLPNFNKLLKKNDIDYEMFTAGEYKRTVTMLGENTHKAREKFREDLEGIHVLFKEFVAEHRPSVDIEKIATGEVWFGRRALAVALIDEIKTSDEYLLALSESADIYEIEFAVKKSLQEKLGIAAQGAVDRLLMTWWERLNIQRWF